MIDEEYIMMIITKALDTATTGVKLGVDDWPHIVISIVAALTSLIPEVGLLISSFTTFLGAILIPSPKAPDPWDAIRARVEALVNAKISEYNVNSLRATVRGLQDNMKYFTRLMNVYQKAAQDRKEKLAETLRGSYNAFLAVLRTNVPRFQMAEYRVQTLAMFGYAATMHLTLLSEGIRNGTQWGFPEEYVDQILTAEFDDHTGFGGAKMLTATTSNMQLNMLQDTIKQGEALNLSTTLLDTWRDAHSVLSSPQNQIVQRGHDDIDPTNYPEYAKKVYLKGRKMVHAPPSPRKGWYDHDKGFKEGWQRRALADYDTFFMTGLLSFAEMWPYMTKKRKMPKKVEDILDREIFAGPYGRYTENVPFDVSKTPPVKPRVDNITEFKFRTGDDVVGFQVKYGDKWGTYWGSKTDGKEFTVKVPKDEHTKKGDHMKKGEHLKHVGVWWGAKIGQLNFSSTPIGPHRHADVSEMVHIPGYALSSVRITHVESHKPPGCEGVLFGFRSLMFK